MKAILMILIVMGSIGTTIEAKQKAEESTAIPETMLAAAIDSGGGPEVLSLHRLPVPAVKPGEVLIAVDAASVSFWELGHRRNPGAGARFPLVFGSDGTGTVAAIGSGVRGFKAGDRVYGLGSGFNAEYTTARAENVAHVPSGISVTEAGILAVSGLSAIQGIDDVLQLKPGETLVIHGASGAVGTLAIQFAKLRGVKVLATASNDEGLALVSRLGADAVVNGKSGDIPAAIHRFAPEGVDAVFGLVGGDALERCIDGLRRDGRGRVAYLHGMEKTPRPRFGVRMILYSYISGVNELKRLNTAVEAAKLEVPIGAEYSLADAAEAHRRLESGGVFGKIVLRVR